MYNLFVYLPCYNEENNIGKLIESWFEEKKGLLQKGYKLLIVAIDDKSTDNTLQIIRNFEKSYEEVRVIAHQNNKNLGGVLNTVIEDFLSLSAENDLMCFMDGDNTHKPIYISAMLHKISNNDCVIASRYQNGSSVIGVPKNRLFMSDCARLYNSFVLRVPNVRDYTCGYRLYTREMLKKVKFMYGNSLVSKQNFSCMMELLYKLHLCGCRFSEIPFVLRYDDKEGSSKMKVIKTMLESIVLALKLKIFRRV